MVEQSKLISNRSEGGSEVTGIPDEDTVECLDGFLAEVVAADGEGAHTLFEFLYRLEANGGSAASEVKTEKVEALLEGGDFRFCGGQRQAQLAAEHIIHEVQGLFGLGVAAAQDHEIVGIAHKAQARLCQSLVEDVQDDVCQERRNDTALGRA